MDDVSDDDDLLRRYARDGDDASFEVIVRRHTDMVYSAARRQVGTRLADEVTQAAFVLLMRKADRLPPGTVVAGWLVRAVRYTAMNAQRAEGRRRRHERKAGHMAVADKQSNPTGANPAWAHVAPLLDDAVARLKPVDRAAVVLRYFERRSLADVGQSLGVSEHAAQMRVTRAVEKLRDIFRRRGVTMTAAALGVIVSAHATEAAPPTLAPSLTASALRTASATAGGVATLADGAIRQMLLAQARTAAKVGIAAVIAIGLGSTIFRVTCELWPGWHKPAASDTPENHAAGGSFLSGYAGRGLG